MLRDFDWASSHPHLATCSGEMLKGSGSVGVAHVYTQTRTHTHQSASHPEPPQCNCDSGALVDDAPDAHKSRTLPDLREAISSGSRQYSHRVDGSTSGRFQHIGRPANNEEKSKTLN